MTGSIRPSPAFNAVKDLNIEITKRKISQNQTCCPIHAGCQVPESTDIQLRLDNRRKQYPKPHETSHAASCSVESDDLVITLGPHSAAALVLGVLL